MPRPIAAPAQIPLGAKDALAKFKVFVSGAGYKFFGCEGSAKKGREELIAKGANVNARMTKEPREPSLAAATCVYGVAFTCAVARDNIFAVQFHPEKSHRYGLRFYKNFAEL